jgi:hypothetical protein
MAVQDDVLFPVSLILPSFPSAKQTTTAKTGTIGMSGATLVFYNGSAWVQVTAA